MNEYEKQAEDFLKETKTTLSITLADPQKKPIWAKDGEKHGLNYTCTLKNEQGTYTFDFWNSIKNREIIEAIGNLKRSIFRDNEHFRAERILEKAGFKTIEINGLSYGKETREQAIKKLEPKAYEILACLSPLYEDTLEDFCSSFGYDNDSITALKTFEACKEQDRNLRKLFTREELERLTEIN